MNEQTTEALLDRMANRAAEKVRLDAADRRRAGRAERQADRDAARYWGGADGRSGYAGQPEEPTSTVGDYDQHEHL